MPLKLQGTLVQPPHGVDYDTQLRIAKLEQAEYDAVKKQDFAQATELKNELEALKANNLDEAGHRMVYHMQADQGSYAAKKAVPVVAKPVRTRACVRACVRAGLCAGLCACLRACMRASVHTCVLVCVHACARAHWQVGVARLASSDFQL